MSDIAHEHIKSTANLIKRPDIKIAAIEERKCS